MSAIVLANRRTSDPRNAVFTKPLVTLLVLSLVSVADAAAQDYVDVLTFESARETGRLTGWNGGPPATLQVDSTVVHEGRYSGRIARDGDSESQFSALTLSIPVEFSGETLELRGWLKTEGVTGFAGLWLREDGRGGAVVQFDNMQDRNLSGTTDWTEYRIRLPLDRAARRVVMGGLLQGEGTLWLDDLELLVDGGPAADAPAYVPERTPIDLDTEFDGGSRVENRDLSAGQVEDLALLGRVWGFMKYHHPRVTEAQLNWDYELFRVMPTVLGTADRASAIRNITRWVEGVGEAEPCTDCANLPTGLHLSPEVGWIRDVDALGTDLSARLVAVYENRLADPKQHYVGHAQVGNPDFSEENAYADHAFPDAGFRLLALYRFWNIIEYWFPYRDILDADWDDVLVQYIPRLMTVEDGDAYRLAMMEVIARIDDTHANLWSSLDVRPPLGTAQLPVVVRFIEGEAVVTGFSHTELGPATGLAVGDVIESIGGEPVESLVDAWRPYYAASNQPTRLRDIGRALTKGSVGRVAVTGRRADGPFNLVAQRAPLDQLDVAAGRTHDRAGDAFQMLSDEVAYLKLSAVVAADAAEYVRRASASEVLVVDIRNYPSEFVVFSLGQHLIRERTEFARFTSGDAPNPGAFLWGDPVALEPAEPHYSGQVVILVDEVSQSQAEYTTMAFRVAPNATVVGSTTAGADGNISSIPLPGGLRSMISGIGVFYPDRSPTQRVGIIPDLEIRPTIAGVREGRDEVLEAAVSHALGRQWRAPSRVLR